MLNLGCDPVDDKLIITNQSDQKIYYTRSQHSQLTKLYQEGSIKEDTYLNYVAEIESNTSRHEILMGRRGKAWRNYIKNSEGGKLRIYTFNIDTLNKYSWKDVIDNNRYFSKKEFAIDDLEKVNWEIKLP